MVMFERSVLGLDTGSHSLKAVELRISPRILAPGQFRVHRRDDEDAPLAEDLQHFVAQHQLPMDQVACALPASQLSTRRLDFPFSDTRRLNQAIPFEIEAETPFDLDDIFVDWNLLEGERNHGVVAATLVKRSHVAADLEVLQSAGCDPQILEAGGLVLANLAPVFGLEGNHLIVDVGHAKTTFCALRQGKPLLARSIPIGGRAMTESISRERDLSFENAEQVKLDGGALGRGAGEESPGVIAVIDRIAREAVRTLEAAEPIRGDGSLTRDAVLTLIGGGALLDRIDELLGHRTGLMTQRLRMPADSTHADLVDGVDPVLFGPALALALRLSGEPVTRINFRQGEYAFRQDFMALFNAQFRPTGVLAAVLISLLAINTITTIALDHHRAGRHRDATNQLYSEAFPERSPAPGNPVTALGNELREARTRADFLGLYSGDRSALDLLAELSRTIPANLTVRVTEINIDRNLIRLDVDAQGFEAADRLTSVLSRTHPFEGAKVAGSIKTDRRTGGVSFSVSIPLAIAGGDA